MAHTKPDLAHLLLNNFNYLKFAEIYVEVTEMFTRRRTIIHDRRHLETDDV
jgi:hypothetical protein